MMYKISTEVTRSSSEQKKTEIIASYAKYTEELILTKKSRSTPPNLMPRLPGYEPDNTSRFHSSSITSRPPPATSQRTFTMAPSMSLFAVNAILILNSEDGSRVFAKYYNAPHHSTTAGHASSTLPHTFPLAPFAHRTRYHIYGLKPN